MNDYITGAGGFIGSHLVKKLGEHIAILHHQLPMWPIKHFSRFFFLSAYGNLAHQTETADILQANIADLGLILQKILANKIACDSFVYLSTSSVLLPVQTAYSRTKAAGEQMVLASGLPGCIVRPFSVVGVGEQKEHLIPTLIRSCFEQTPVDLVFDATHDFVDVEDVVKAICFLSENNHQGIFELGWGVTWSNRSVLQIVQDVCKRKAVIRQVKSFRSYDTEDWCCKNRVNQLGCQPTKHLTQSIEEMVAAYQDERARKTDH